MTSSLSTLGKAIQVDLAGDAIEAERCHLHNEELVHDAIHQHGSDLQIPVSNHKLRAMNTIETLAYAASLPKFNGTGFALLADDVRNLHTDNLRKERNAIIQSYFAQSPRLALKEPEHACKPVGNANRQ